MGKAYDTERGYGALILLAMTGFKSVVTRLPGLPERRSDITELWTKINGSNQGTFFLLTTVIVLQKRFLIDTEV